MRTTLILLSAIIFAFSAHAQTPSSISDEDNVAGVVLYKTLKMHQAGTVFHQVCEGGDRASMLDTSKPANVNLMKNQLVIREKIGAFEAAMHQKYFTDTPPADLSVAINKRMQNAVLNEGVVAQGQIEKQGCDSDYAENLKGHWTLFTRHGPQFIAQFIDGMVEVKIEELTKEDVVDEDENVIEDGGEWLQLKTMNHDDE